MDTTNDLITTPATAGHSSCHGGGQGSGGWLSRRRGLVFGGGAIVTVIALGLSQNRLTVAELTPLLSLLPCTVMMLMGMNHGRQAAGAPAPGAADKPTGTNAAPG